MDLCAGTAVSRFVAPSPHRQHGRRPLGSNAHLVHSEKRSRPRNHQTPIHRRDLKFLKSTSENTGESFGVPSSNVSTWESGTETFDNQISETKEDFPFDPSPTKSSLRNLCDALRLCEKSASDFSSKVNSIGLKQAQVPKLMLIDYRERGHHQPHGTDGSAKLYNTFAEDIATYCRPPTE